MLGGVYSPNPCFPIWDQESQTSLPWERDVLCAIPSRPTNTRCCKPHREKPVRQSNGNTANGPSVTLLHSEVSSCPMHGCGEGLTYPCPQGPEHSMEGCTLPPPPCSLVPGAVGKPDLLLSDHFLRTERQTRIWKLLNTVLAGRAPHVLSSSFAERSFHRKLGPAL